MHACPEHGGILYISGRHGNMHSWVDETTYLSKMSIKSGACISEILSSGVALYATLVLMDYFMYKDCRQWHQLLVVQQEIPRQLQN